MKVGLISSWKPFRCGISNYSQDLSKALAQLDVESEIIPIHRLGMKDPEYFKFLAYQRAPKDVDVFHVQFEYGLFGTNTLASVATLYEGLRSYGKPVISTLHAVAFNPFIDEVVAGMSDLCIVHNQHCQDLFKGKSVIVPHGCWPVKLEKTKEEAKEKMGLKDRKHIIAAHGFVSEYKGYAEIIHAIKDLPDVTLVIAGGFLVDITTNIQAELQAIANQWAPGRVMFTGYIPDDKLKTVFEASDLVVNSHKLMTTSGSIIRALAHGKCVLAINQKPNIEMEEHTGGSVLATFKTVGELTEKIRYYLEHENERSQLERNAYRYAEETSWLNIAEKHIQLYTKLLEEKKTAEEIREIINPEYLETLKQVKQ